MKKSSVPMIGEVTGNSNEFCPLCEIALATHDPEKFMRGGIAYHHACLKKTTQPISKPVQRWFQFQQGLYVQ